MKTTRDLKFISQRALIDYCQRNKDELTAKGIYAYNAYERKGRFFLPMKGQGGQDAIRTTGRIGSSWSDKPTRSNTSNQRTTKKARQLYGTSQRNK